VAPSSERDGGIFDTYAQSFDAVWTTAKPVSEE
jgi:hypothetical protein